MRYTKEQRDEVIEAVNAGLSKKQAAKNFKVSLASVANWTGSNKKHKRIKRSISSSTNEQRAVPTPTALLEAQLKISMEENSKLRYLLSQQMINKLDSVSPSFSSF